MTSIYNLPGREADHSPPSSAEAKEYVELYIHSTIRLHGVVLSKVKGQLYLYFYVQPAGCYILVYICTMTSIYDLQEA
jgi:hypothetical protein